MPSNEPNPLDLLDPENRRIAQRRYIRQLLLINGIAVLGPLAILGALWLSSDHAGNGDEAIALVSLVFAITVIAVLAVLAIINGVSLLLWRRGVWWAQPSPMLAWRFKDRRRLVKALRRDEPTPDGLDPRVVHASLRWLARMRAYLLIMPVIAVALLVMNTVLQELRSHSTFLLAYNGCLAVFVVVVLIRRNRPITRNARIRLHNAVDPAVNRTTEATGEVTE